MNILEYSDNNTIYKIRSFKDSNNNIWVIGNDLAKCLGYTRPNNVINKHVSNENKLIFKEFKQLNNIQSDIDLRITVINRIGIKSLIYSSKLNINKYYGWINNFIEYVDNNKLHNLNMSLKNKLNNVQQQKNDILHQLNKLEYQKNKLQEKLDKLNQPETDNINLHEQFIIIKLFDINENDNKDNYYEYQYHIIRAQRRSIRKSINDIKIKYKINNPNIVMKINYVKNSVMLNNKIKELMENSYIKSFGNEFNIINGKTLEEVKNIIYMINCNKYN